MRRPGWPWLGVLALGLLACAAYAQGTGDGPTAVVTMPGNGTTVSDPAMGWSDALGNLTWPGAAYGVVHRFLAVLERMVTDTRGWLDRWLDKTNGKIKIDYRKTVVSAFSENDPDRTGPIPIQHNRRSTDRDRNGSSGEEPPEDH